MTDASKWTMLDEAMLLYARTLEQELRKSHSILFAAEFLDEFEREIRGIAFHSLLSQRPWQNPPS